MPRFFSSFLFSTIACLSFGTVACAVDTDAPAPDLSASESRRARGVTVAPNPDGTCPVGFELEIEHGVISCKTHRSSSSSSSGSTSSTSSSGSTSSTSSSGASGTPGPTACQTDADCPAGQECEIEIEHGVTTATCRDHGGRRGGRR